MAVGLRKLATKLSPDDIRRLAKAQKLESARKRLEKQERDHARQSAAAAKRRERIERKLDALFGRKAGRPKKKRKMSAAGRANIRAAVRARWKRYWEKKGRKAPAPATVS